MDKAIFAPALVLVLWTIFVLIWMTAARMNAPGEKVDMSKVPAGVRGVDFEDKMPPATNWKAHNYAHLLEQPTLFYATVVMLAVLGAAALDVWLAWGYVALRIAHSLWQSTVNRIPLRFLLFLVSTLVLAVLAVRALLLALG